VVGAVGWSLVEEFASQRQHWSLGVSAVTAATFWLIGVIGLAVLSTVGLTATRIVIPLSAVVAAAAMASEPGLDSIGFAIAAAVATIGVLSGECGHRFIQSSAYGDEHRFGLRPPAGYLVAATIAWIVWAGLTVAAVAALATSRYWLGVALGVIRAVFSVAAAPRWHLLSTRWLVLVPAGLVVHDRLVLAETIMLKRSQLAGLGLAEADSTALDITGPSSGYALEIRSNAPFQVVRAPQTRGADAVAETTAAVLVAPTRPGRALEASQAQQISVGVPD